MVIEQKALLTPSTEVAAGTAFTLLVGLAAASRASRSELPPDLRDVLDAVGDTTGETWLNLLGVPLDEGPPYSVERLADALLSLDGLELRRHLLGRHAWSWCTLGGVDDIEAAAAGDPDAAARLLAKPRYYGGDAERALRVLIGLDADETQRRVVAAVEAGARALVAPDAEELLADALRAAEDALAAEPIPDAIERLTTGYRYVPELEAGRVVLLPHLDSTLALVLAQHRSARLIAYRARVDHSREERAVALGRALADPKRVEILALVGRGTGRSPELVDATGLARSTVHHHLAQLRDAGLVALEGNARAYTYTTRGEAVSEIAALIANLIGTEEH
jgi:DNA-binding transcriptional ArsR family regulator